MAQALYDEHPLNKYLEESGDGRRRLPGTFTVTDVSDEESEDGSTADACLDFALSPSLMKNVLNVLQPWTTTLRDIFLSTSDDFAERFKYDLISSNLLSSSVALSPVSVQPRPNFPHAREQQVPGELDAPRQDVAEKVDEDLKPLSTALVIVGVIALLSQHRFTALWALVASVSFAKAPGVGSVKQTYIPQMFEVLEGLKKAGSAWDFAVNEAITIIDNEERNTYYTPSSSSPLSPSSALRVALHSTLLTTQNQCDNVRPLLATLASPLELSQLSEMYAPPAPAKQSYTLQARPSTHHHKPSSLSENYVQDSPSQFPDSAEKRQTWNGYNVSPSRRTSLTSIALRKKEWRRSDLSTFTNVQNVLSPAPVTPPRSPRSPHSPTLDQVLEADEDDEQVRASPMSDLKNKQIMSQDKFGTAALFLRRRRRASGAEVLGLMTPRSVPSLRDSAHLSLSSISSSRLTSLSSSRHPFSLTALHHALHGALASRRYACAHLLALRFTEDTEDDSYWENVRSVTALLTTTFEDAASRLNEALTEAYKLKQQEGEPTPESSPDGSPVKTPNDELHVVGASAGPSIDNLLSPAQVSKPSMLLYLQQTFLSENTDSFAPMPNAVARFASHVDALSSSLNDAKARLLECVQDLRDAQSSAAVGSSSRETGSSKASEETILQSYEQLRRELGFALRECERGKTALLDIFEARRMQEHSLDGSEEADDETEPLLGHAHSGSSKDSNDKTDQDPMTPDEGSPVNPMLSILDDGSAERDVDDVTHHLLISASSAHLSPPGLEQIFESDSVPLTNFKRERSKLTREERIRSMKAKRESMTGRGLAAQLEEDNDSDLASHRSWGPGTDVVEELKDVIWKVGERRRKVAEISPLQALRPSLISVPTNGRSDEPDDYDTSLCTL